MRTTLLALTLACLLPAPVRGDVLSDLDTYEYEAQALLHDIERGAGRDRLSQRAATLLDLAAAITPAFVDREPACAAYLRAALDVREAWPDLDADSIERDYHKDAALPVAGTPPVCYHMKDLIVHPATVLVLLRAAEPDRTQARREIDEVMAHIAVVRALM